MSALLPTKGTEVSAKQVTALLSLLADENPVIYQTVRARLLSLGLPALKWLRPKLLSDDPVLRRRVREIVDYLHRQTADNEFLAFCLKQGAEFDLEQAIWLLSSTQYPNINPLGYGALLDAYADRLRARTKHCFTPEHLINSINEYLFSDLGFSGNEKDYYDPDNSYFNRVLDRRVGNPISLCLLYLFTARRLKLPMTGIALPGHFVCRFQSSRGEIYVDAFHNGRLLRKADCVQYLLQVSPRLEENHLTPATSRRILLRICANLHQIYTELGRGEERERFQRYMVALSNYEKWRGYCL